MRVGTGGLKDGSGTVIMVGVSDAECEDVLRQYRAVNQVALRFDFVTDQETAVLMLSLYPPGTPWCFAGEVPEWFQPVWPGYINLFGLSRRQSDAIAAYNDEYAINPKLLDRPTS